MYLGAADFGQFQCQNVQFPHKDPDQQLRFRPIADCDTRNLPGRGHEARGEADAKWSTLVNTLLIIIFPKLFF